MNNYKLISDYKEKFFLEAVNEAIKDGCQLVGGVSVTSCNGMLFYAQAVYKGE
jgi:hypothetical protein